MGLVETLSTIRGQVLHNTVKASRQTLSDLASLTCNIVHLRRPWGHMREELLGVTRAHPSLRRRVSAVARQPQPAVHTLLQPLVMSDAAFTALHEDVCQLVSSYAEVVQVPHVNVKLEVLHATPCPRWHADHVTARLLVTYLGPGTEFVENRFVERRWSLASGQVDPSVGHVDAQAAQQAGEGDILLLKGHAWPGSLHVTPNHLHKRLSQPVRLRFLSGPETPGICRTSSAVAMEDRRKSACICSR
ncbi:hypothetical protein QJQ45_013450 [Haematococcus lacustris]|nr:hypothetical protein QJQ45_013450 [Haematococcus lacustris]